MVEKFSNIDGRESEVELANQVPIGGGMRGDAFEVDVKIGDHTKKFVLKKFVDYPIHLPHETLVETASQSAASAFLNHGLAKEAGLKTFTTYRLGDDGESVLMTNANIEGKICVGSNSHGVTLETLGHEKLKGIRNFDSLLENTFAEARKAGEHDLVLWGDALFFLVDPVTNDVDFVVGDYDSLSYKSNNKVLVGALHTARALTMFVQENVDNPSGYITKIDEYLKNFKKSLVLK